MPCIFHFSGIDHGEEVSIKQMPDAVPRGLFRAVTLPWTSSRPFLLLTLKHEGEGGSFTGYSSKANRLSSDTQWSTVRLSHIVPHIVHYFPQGNIDFSQHCFKKCFGVHWASAGTILI